MSYLFVKRGSKDENGEWFYQGRIYTPEQIEFAKRMIGTVYSYDIWYKDVICFKELPELEKRYGPNADREYYAVIEDEQIRLKLNELNGG